MGGSIHIHGTGSSIIDSIFVCRSHGVARRSQLFSTSTELIEIIRRELVQLRAAGVKPTAGDVRCIVYGHLARIAVWNLRTSWETEVPTRDRLSRFAAAVAAIGNSQTVIDMIVNNHHLPTMRVSEPFKPYGLAKDDAIPF
jgi:hypothetical protein